MEVRPNRGWSQSSTQLGTPVNTDALNLNSISSSLPTPGYSHERAQVAADFEDIGLSDDVPPLPGTAAQPTQLRGSTVSLPPSVPSTRNLLSSTKVSRPS